MQPFAKVAAIVIVVLVITVLPGAPVNAAPSIGVVKLIKVNAYGTPSGESQREIFIRSEIFPSELVETVAQGAAHLRFNDETEIRIGSAGRLVLDSFVYARGSQPDRLIASFSRGALRFISGKMAKPGVQLVTPAVLIGIRGTDFTVSVDELGNTAVAVAEGIVELTPLGGGANQLITVGQIASVAVGSSSIEVEPGFSVTQDPGLSNDAGIGSETAGDGAASSSGSAESCFVGATLVLMADGTTRSIDAVRVGDRVAAYDFKKERRISAEVAGIFSTSAQSYLRINGIGVTRRHPFAVGPHRWKVAGTLMTGDTLFEGSVVRIRAIETIASESQVFNLTIGSVANFYVSDGNRAYLVHNKD